MNKKSEFIQWLQSKSIYQRYTGSFESFINRYIEYIEFDPFEINDKSVISEIIAQLKSKENLLKENPEFIKFKNYGNGVPSGIMGKNNLYEYLQQLNFKQRTFTKDYFDLDGLKEYSKVARTTYESETIASDWFYDTRNKLYYLVELLAERLNTGYDIVYKEKPNGQAGQAKIVFKNYVLAGFAPKEAQIGDDLFIKVEFGELKDNPNLNINLDINFSNSEGRFFEQRDTIYQNSYLSWDIDDNFPKNWNDLIELLHPEIKKLQERFLVYTTLSIGNDLTMSTENLTLLKYKKQIILQGPPGTGKTKMAKELAIQLCQSRQLTDEQIINNIIPGITIRSAKDYVEYKILGIESNSIVRMQNQSNNDASTDFNAIKSAFTSRIWENGIIDSGAVSYAAAIAKYLYSKIGLNYIKLLQFHPSYTYEDFVRGIVAKPNENGDGILYEAEDKLLGKFARDAYQNYIDSKKTIEAISKEKWVDEQFEKFKSKIANDLEMGTYPINDKTIIVEVTDKSFKYTGANNSWLKTPAHRMKFADIKQAYLDDNKEKNDVHVNPNLSGLARRHYGWYFKVLNDFREFLNQNGIDYNGSNKPKVELQNYILIIDEINRANLSSVLGELIYALEYRGETVESMYEVEESNELILPPNLYIIGTMNTADRSVGHIDYAIRRRFAFVEVLPKDLREELGADFHIVLFNKVSALFNHESNLSKEFEREDVRLGHSYFIQQYEENENGEPDKSKPYDFKLRLEYEIKPILLEYVKDGILINGKDITDIKDYITNLAVDNEG